MVVFYRDMRRLTRSAAAGATPGRGTRRRLGDDDHASDARRSSTLKIAMRESPDA
jgi:hypothetical protein